MSLPKWATGFGAQVIYGLIIGLVLGLIADDWLAGLLEWVGGTYVQLLKLLIPPLVFTAVVTSIAKLREVTNAARLAAQTLIWFAITAFFSVLIGIAVGFAAKNKMSAMPRFLSATMSEFAKDRERMSQP